MALPIVMLCVLCILPMSDNAEIQLTPDRSIQDALSKAQPGDTIFLEPGLYNQSFDTVRHGTKEKPITLKGNKHSIVIGDGRHRVIQVFHDNIHLIGFKVDGLNGPPVEENFAGKLVYAQGNETIDGLKIINMTFNNSGGEALRLRNCHNAEVVNSTFFNTGVHDFRFNDTGKNGEAIYIGTSSNDWEIPDESSGNWIHHNFFNTQGNECVDVKEGSHNNIIEYNNCTGQKDINSSGISIRGDNNTIRNNVVYSNLGAGIRLGGNKVGDVRYGKNNKVYNNTLFNNSVEEIKILVQPQKIHDNKIEEREKTDFPDFSI